MNNKIVFLYTVIALTICSQIQSQELKLCYSRDIRSIIDFEKKCNSKPSNFEWSDNLEFYQGKPMVFIRPKVGNIELTVEYFFQEKNSQRCSSVILQWDNSVIWLPKSNIDTNILDQEYKAIFFNIANKFKLDTTQFLFAKKYDSFNKEFYLKEFKTTEFENRKISLELIYFYNSLQRRVRIYYDY
jgi:hypothetical protein